MANHGFSEHGERELDTIEASRGQSLLSALENKFETARHFISEVRSQECVGGGWAGFVLFGFNRNLIPTKIEALTIKEVSF